MGGTTLDEKQFDGITRALASGMTRRGGIGALIAAVAGAAGVSVAAANPGRRHEKLACRNANSECTSNDQCCSGSCVPKPEGGTGFRCAKRHAKKPKNKNEKEAPVGPVVPLGEPCEPGFSVCERGRCQSFSENPLVQDPAGTYCLLNDGDACALDAGIFPSPICKGMYCVTTSGNPNDGGECGRIVSVDSCLNKDTCTGTDLYMMGPFGPLVLVCLPNEDGWATVYPVGTAGSCQTSADCDYDYVCLQASSVANNSCTTFFSQGAGQCVPGLYSCNPDGSWQTQCPDRGQTAATSCDTYGGMFDACYYYSN